MRYKLTVFLFVVVILECNGQLPILGDFLSNTRNKIHSGVEGVAGAILGGFNLNLHGQTNRQRPQNVPQNGPEETIIVVVEEPDDSNQGPPPHHHHHHHHRQRPPHNHYRPAPPPPPPHHHRPFPTPGYNSQDRRPYHHNEYENNQNWGKQGNDNNFYGNNQNERPYDNKGYLPNPTGIEKNLEVGNNKKNPYDDGASTNPFYKSTTEYVKIMDPTKASPLPNDDKMNKVTTEKTSDDLPLFVPLNPNEYIYGGDKINITAPKRDTENSNPVNSDDEDFSIDIRLKKE